MNVFANIVLPKVIYETSSKFNEKIQVVQRGDTLRLRVNGVVQSVNFDSPVVNKMYWGKLIKLLKEKAPDMDEVLILGLGGGTLPHLISKEFPNTEIVTVEIDKTMIDIAAKYFDLTSVPHHNVFNADAMHFVIEPESYGYENGKFDVAIVDIYCGEKYPELGSSGNFIASLKRLVKPGGLLVFNRLYLNQHQDDVNCFVDQVEMYLSNVSSEIVAGITNSDNILIFGYNEG